MNDLTKQKQQNFKHKTILMLILNAIGYLCFYLVNAVLARFLSTVDYGTYGLVYNVILSLGFFFIFGFDDAAIYFTTLYVKKEKWSLLRGFLKFLQRMLIVVGCPLILVSIIFFGVHYFHHDTFKLNDFLYLLENTHPALLFLWIIPLLIMLLILNAILFGLNHQISGITLRFVIVPFAQLAMLATCYLVVGHLHAHYAIFVYGLALMIAIVFQLLRVKRLLPTQLWNTVPAQEAKIWLGYALPVIVINVIFACQDTTILTIFKLQHNKQTYLAFYMAITTISGYIINNVFYTILGLFSIHIAPLWAEKKYATLQKIMDNAFYTLTSMSILFALAIAVFGKKLLHHFGASYVAVYPGLLIYTFSACLNCATMGWQTLLSYTDNVACLSRNFVISYVFLILGTIVTSYANFSFNTIMLGCALFEIVLFLTTWFNVKQKLSPIQPFPWPTSTRADLPCD